MEFRLNLLVFLITCISNLRKVIVGSSLHLKALAKHLLLSQLFGIHVILESGIKLILNVCKQNFAILVNFFWAKAGIGPVLHRLVEFVILILDFEYVLISQICHLSCLLPVRINSFYVVLDLIKNESLLIKLQLSGLF